MQEKQTIGMFFADKEYLQGLLDYVRRSEIQRMIHVRVFSFMPPRDALSGIDLYLIDENSFFSHERAKAGIPTIEVVYERSKIENYWNRVYAYMPLDQLFQSVLNAYRVYHQSVEQENAPTVSTRFLSFFSVCGGSGKSTAAITLAHQLAIKGKRILYLNFEDVPGDYFGEGHIGLPDLSEYLYELNKQTPNETFWDDRRHQKLKIYRLQLRVQFRDLTEMEEHDFELLLQSLRNSGRFDWVFFDLSSQLSNTNFKLFLASDSICWLLTNRRHDARRTNMMLDYVNRVEQFNQWEWLKKCTFIFNQLMWTDENELNIPELKVAACLPFVSQTLIDNEFPMLICDSSYTERLNEWFMQHNQ